jgi:hypothetical protein
MGGAAAGAGRGYEIAGPAGPSRDTPLCRRLAHALNAEPARELDAPRADPLFARWRPHEPPDPDVFIEATRADLLNEGRPRTVYRVTYSDLPWGAQQSLVFMRDDAEPLPQRERDGPSVWAEATQSGRLVVPERFIFSSEGGPEAWLLTRYPPFGTAAGKRIGHNLARSDARDLVLPGDGRVMMLLENTKERVAMLVELRGHQASAICYLSGRRERRGKR